MNSQNHVAFSILCCGLDNAGKTTLCRNLSNSQRNEILPTPNMEIHYVNVQKLGRTVLLYDVSGNRRHRDNWRFFYSEVQAIMYVVDASDSEDRFKIQKALIEEILNDDIIKSLHQPIVFMLNKQDKENRFDKDELVKVLGLETRKYKNKIFIKETSGFNGAGLKESIEVLSDALFARRS